MNGVLSLVAVAPVVWACVSAPQVFQMEWVTVGDPGNTPDDKLMWADGTTGYGGVAYTYSIGKYEATNAQYTQFLNAVARSDPHGLYSYTPDPYLGITRFGSSGSYTYATVAGRANMPVNYMNWYDALRFANWMHNYQPTGAQSALTTEDGAYDMSLGTSVVRKPGARVFLPSEDEWYKAAYYKAGGTNAGYWDYPTQTEHRFLPTPEAPPGTDVINGSANYLRTWPTVSDTTDVGAYTAKPSDSAYGTFDQGGNVFEWNETDIRGDGAYRGLRGGFFAADWTLLHARQRRIFEEPWYDDAGRGFRVAKAPEPSLICGNGTIEFTEECDDNNTDDGDGCSSTCAVEDEFSCHGEPSVCSADPIPTISEWGMITMVLLVLTAAKLAWARRPTAIV